MSPDAIGAFGLAVTILLALMGWIWHVASWRTSHEIRIGSLEKAHDGLIRSIDRLASAITRLDKKLAVSDIRQSQGQYADTEPPTRGD
jgi:hypothetical protein